MIRTKKKLGNLIVLGLLCIIGVQSGVTVAKAEGNYHDSDFMFDFEGPDRWETSEQRLKEDTTSAYMYCIWAMEPVDAYQAYVWAYDPNNDRHFCTSDGYIFHQYDWYYMINYTYERGYRFEYIKGRLCDGGTDGIGVFSGYWSPDSI